jgi:hypothetical protein
MADDRAIPVRVVTGQSELPYYQRQTWALLTRDGRLEPLLEGIPGGDGIWDVFTAEPCPTDANLVAFGSVAVVHRDEQRLVRAGTPFIGHHSSYDLWAPSAGEIRFTNRVPGKGAGFPAMRFRPKVEYPPYSDELRLRVSAGGECLYLRTTPGIASDSLVSLADGTEVTHVPGPADEFGRYDPDGNNGSIWASVQLDSGEKGWLSAEFLEWA